MLEWVALSFWLAFIDLLYERRLLTVLSNLVMIVQTLRHVLLIVPLRFEGVPGVGNASGSSYEWH